MKRVANQRGELFTVTEVEAPRSMGLVLGDYKVTLQSKNDNRVMEKMAMELAIYADEHVAKW